MVLSDHSRSLSTILCPRGTFRKKWHADLFALVLMNVGAVGGTILFTKINWEILWLLARVLLVRSACPWPVY